MSYFWRTDEIELLKIGVQPQDRTYNAIKQFCYRNKLITPSKKNSDLLIKALRKFVNEKCKAD